MHAKEHRNPGIQQHFRIMMSEMQIMRRKQLSQLWAQQDLAAGLSTEWRLGNKEWILAQTEELIRQVALRKPGIVSCARQSIADA